MSQVSRGTGPVRFARFKAAFAHCADCQHKCGQCGKVFRHKAVAACHFPVFQECEQCFTFPEGLRGSA